MKVSKEKGQRECVVTERSARSAARVQRKAKTARMYAREREGSEALALK